MLNIYAFLTVLLVAFYPIKSATHYVSSSSGSDSNDGSLTHPYKTLTHVTWLSAHDRINPGDSILFKRGDTWVGEGLILSAPYGTPLDPIVIGSYGSGDKPIFDGTGAVLDVGINLKCAHYIIKNIEIKYFEHYGIYAHLNSQYDVIDLTIDDVYVHNIGDKDHSRGIIITGSDWKILNSTIDSNFNDGINGFGTNFEIAFNNITNNGLGPIGDGIQLTEGSGDYWVHDNYFTSNNHIKGIFTSNSTGLDNAGIFEKNICIGGGWGARVGGQGGIVRFNYFQDSWTYDESGGMGIQFSGLNNIAYANIIYNCEKGISVSNNENTGASVEIYNNTVVNASVKALDFQGVNDFPITVTCKNNIFYQFNIAVLLASGSNIIESDNNLFYPESPLMFSTSFGDYDNLQEWRNATGFDINSISADPLLTDVENMNFDLMYNSPAIDIGQILSSPANIDYDGTLRPQGLSFDLGACEFYDNIQPEVLRAFLHNESTLIMAFSEKVDEISAEDISNYFINNGITVTSAWLLPSGKKVKLTTSPHSTNKTYTLTVNDVTDLFGNPVSQLNNFTSYELQVVPEDLEKLEVSEVTASTFSEPEHAPEKSIDGNGYLSGDPDSRWTGSSLNEWILFDLGSVELTSLIRIEFYKWDENCIYEYSLFVSDDSNSWEEVVSHGLSSIDEWTDIFLDNVPTRFIKVVFHDADLSTQAGIWEIETWGEQSTTLSEDFTKDINFELLHNFPNPFNPSTIIKYSIPEKEFVSLKVYNILGKEVAELVSNVQTEGFYSVTFDASGFSSGVYIYKLQAGSFTASHKMLLIK